MSRKILLFISAFSILLILILALFTISNTSHTTHKSGNEMIAEQKAREVFFFKHFPDTVQRYEVDVSEVSNCTDILQRHKIYSTVASMGWSPPRAQVNVGVGLDGKAFSLPDEFNEVFLREQINVDSEEKALEVADTYIKCSYPYRFSEILILNSSNYIPTGGQGKEPDVFASVIKPPQIRQEKSAYFLTFHTWEEIGGYLKEWSFIIDENGIANANDKEISRLVGNYGGLE